MQRKKQAKTKVVGTAAKKKPRKVSHDLTVGFRPRTSDDDDFILQLTETQMGPVYQAAFGESFPREQYLRYIQSGAPTYVILQSNKRIGYYSYLLDHDRKMHISALVLDPLHQSDGIGTYVMKHVEREALTQGVNTLEVYVQANNAQSLAFTRKLGFVEMFHPMPNTICFRKMLGASQQTGFDTDRQAQFVGYFPYNW